MEFGHSHHSKRVYKGILKYYTIFELLLEVDLYGKLDVCEQMYSYLGTIFCCSFFFLICYSTVGEIAAKFQQRLFAEIVSSIHARCYAFFDILELFELEPVNFASTLILCYEFYGSFYKAMPEDRRPGHLLDFCSILFKILHILGIEKDYQFFDGKY